MDGRLCGKAVEREDRVKHGLGVAFVILTPQFLVASHGTGGSLAYYVAARNSILSRLSTIVTVREGGREEGREGGRERGQDEGGIAPCDMLRRKGLLSWHITLYRPPPSLAPNLRIMQQQSHTSRLLFLQRRAEPVPLVCPLLPGNQRR